MEWAGPGTTPIIAASTLADRVGRPRREIDLDVTHVVLHFRAYRCAGVRLCSRAPIRLVVTIAPPPTESANRLLASNIPGDGGRRVGHVLIRGTRLIPASLCLSRTISIRRHYRRLM